MGSPHCPKWIHNFPTIPTESPLSPYVPPGWSLSFDNKVAGRQWEEYDKKCRNDWGVPPESPLSPLNPQYPHIVLLSPIVPQGWSLSFNDKVAGCERKEYDKKHRNDSGSPSRIPTESPLSPLNPQYPHMVPLSPYVPLGWSLSLDDKVAGREREEYDKKRRGPAK